MGGRPPDGIDVPDWRCEPNQTRETVRGAD
jgi:hypothetical protein